MKNIKKAASLIMGLSLAATSAAAANLNVSLGSDDKLTLTGSDFKNGAVSITIANSSEGDTYTGNTKFIFLKEVIPDYTGSIELSYSIPSDTQSGNYVVSAYDKSGETKQTFFYINKEAAQEAFDRLDKIANLDKTQAYAEFKSVINSYRVELGIDMELNDSTLNLDETAKWFIQYLPDSKFNIDSFNKCWLSAKLSGGKTYTAEEFVEQINASLTLLGCEKLPFVKLENEEKEKVFETFIKSEKKEADFAANLNESALITLVNDPEITRAEFEKAVIEDYKDYLGIATIEYEKLVLPENVISALMKKTYTNSEDIAKMFNNEVYNQKNSESSSSSSSSGGSGSGGGGGRVTASGSFDAGVSAPAPGVSAPQSTPASSFADLKDHWAKDAVEALKAKGIVSGVGNGNYEPDRQLTRAEFAKMIAQSFFASNAEGSAQFADVSESDWYASYVAKLASLGVINGMGDGSFAPNSPVTRQDAALIMYRTAKLAGVSVEAVRQSAAFGDTIADYAKEAIDVLYCAGLINGVSADRFEARSNVTRAQAAQLVYNMMK